MNDEVTVIRGSFFRWLVRHLEKNQGREEEADGSSPLHRKNHVLKITRLMWKILRRM